MSESRKQFEAWECDADQGPQTDPMWLMFNEENNTYGLDKIQDRWVAWQASREALVIELPQIVAYDAGYDSLCNNDYASNPDELFDADEVFALHRSIEVQEAIEAAGVKVKP